MNDEFWTYLQQLVDASECKIERPKGSMHPIFISQPYPADYGYLLQTTSSDKHEADIWMGSLNGNTVNGILCSVDLYKRDVELTILINCTDDEI
jgi:inorganic pyrophosphatase